jgi:hypothetical protein
MTNPETTETTPPYIVVGEWVDTEPVDPMRGPRQHPFGLMNAYNILLPDGRHLIFPSKEAADDFAINEACDVYR